MSQRCDLSNQSLLWCVFYILYLQVAEFHLMKSCSHTSLSGSMVCKCNWQSRKERLANLHRAINFRTKWEDLPHRIQCFAGRFRFLSLGITRGWTESGNSELQLYLVFVSRTLFGISYKSFVLAALLVTLLNATQILPLPMQGYFLHSVILVRMQWTGLIGTDRTSCAHL
jgi:hypothetical protein